MIRVALFLAGGLLLIWLIRLNWIGRKKLGMYESNRIYRWFDRHGLTTFALTLHFSIVASLLVLWLFTDGVIPMAIVVGILLTNAIIDNASIGRFRTCKQLCPEFENCMRRRRQICYKIWDKARRRLFR